MESGENLGVDVFNSLKFPHTFQRQIFNRIFAPFWRREKMKRLAICAVIVLFTTGYVTAGTWATLNMPSMSRTDILGVSGSNFVGSYSTRYGDTRGFLYNGSTWTTIQYPNTTNKNEVFDISGNTLVGYYISDRVHGFTYDGTNWNTIDMPGAGQTYPQAINGTSIAGYYTDSDYNSHGFLYDGQTWTPLDAPGAWQTEVHAIDGSTLAGWYISNGYHGFLYNDTHWTTLDKPGAISTQIVGISGNYIVGNADSHGFLYDGTNWTTLDMPGANYTVVKGIDGDKVVGLYQSVSGQFINGFVYTIPEPATLLLFGLGAVVMRKRK
jgi:hypothetical protein